MKTLTSIALACICLATTSCKKDSIIADKVVTKNEVHYNFSMNGVPSKLIYTSITQNETVTLNNIYTAEKTAGVYPAYVAPDFVNSGDHIHLEMSNSKKVVGYMVYITYVKHLDNGTTNELVIGSSSNIVTDNSGNNTVSIDKTFTDADFK